MTSSIITPLAMAAGFCFFLIVLHKKTAFAATWKPAFLLCGITVLLFLALVVPGRVYFLAPTGGWVMCAGAYAAYAMIFDRSHVLGRKFAVFGGIFIYLFLPITLSLILAFLYHVLPF